MPVAAELKPLLINLDLNHHLRHHGQVAHVGRAWQAADYTGSSRMPVPVACKSDATALRS
ncbi:hypothetical protein RKD23_007989 [Streptomyces sp. SAI-170]